MPPGEPPTRPDAIARLVARILDRTGITRTLALATPLPVLLAIALLLDEIDALRGEAGFVRTSPPPEGEP